MSLEPVPVGAPGAAVFRLARVVAVALLVACPAFLLTELVGSLASGRDDWTLTLPEPPLLGVGVGVAALLPLWWRTGRHPYVPRLVLLAALALGWLSLMSGATSAAWLAGAVAVVALVLLVVGAVRRRSVRRRPAGPSGRTGTVP